MRLTLDWDDADAVREHYADALSAVGSDWQVWASANGGATVDVDGPDGEVSVPYGSHFVGWGLGISVPGLFALRDSLGDDGRRLTLDKKRWNRGSPHLQLLFRRKYVPYREVPHETDTVFGRAHDGGKPAHLVQGLGLGFPEEEQIKDPETGDLNYPKIARLLVSEPRTRFESGAALMDRVKKRKNVTYTKRSADLFYDVKTAKRDWVTGEATTDAQRAVKKALRDWAETEGLGHYRDGRAGPNTPREWPPDETTRRRAYVEYVDIVWDETREERDGDDYLRELNITTSTVNPNHTNPQLHYTHSDVTKHAMDRLNPTSPDGVTLEHQRGPAPDRARANPKTAIDEPIQRGQDARMWDDRRIDDGEVSAYLNNLPTKKRADAASLARTFGCFEVTLYDDTGTSAIWHVLGVDTTSSGEPISEATILKDSQGWW